TVNFAIVAVGFANVAAGLLQYVGGVEPALQVATAQLALRVLLIAGALQRLLVLHLVFGKLRWFVYFRHVDRGPQSEFRGFATEAQSLLAAVRATAYFTALHTLFLRSRAPVAPMAPLMRAPTPLPKSMSMNADIWPSNRLP